MAAPIAQLSDTDLQKVRKHLEDLTAATNKDIADLPKADWRSVVKNIEDAWEKLNEEEKKRRGGLMSSDLEAENAVRDAFSHVEVANQHTIQNTARDLLGGKVDPQRINKAIYDMVDRGELEAPTDRYNPLKDWKLL
jgi:hypothetical protein